MKVTVLCVETNNSSRSLFNFFCYARSTSTFVSGQSSDWEGEGGYVVFREWMAFLHCLCVPGKSSSIARWARRHSDQYILRSSWTEIFVWHWSVLTYCLRLFMLDEEMSSVSLFVSVSFVSLSLKRCLHWKFALLCIVWLKSEYRIQKFYGLWIT